MIFLLLSTLFLSSLNHNTRAEISSKWPAQNQVLDERADEVHDAEILRAVITSMKEWSDKHNRTRIKRSQSSRVCYEQLGCFEDSGPFGYLEMLPSPPQEINTRFLLYSTKSRGDIPLLDVPFGNLTAAWKWADRAFNTSSPTKVIVHGFGSNCDHVWVYEMRSALMAVEECNVICVDWEAGALVPNYVRAAANTRLVGKQLAMLLEGLADHINLKFDRVHLIGFSLGAHVAGFAGSQLKNISRITGLDPAGPLFEAQDSRARLDSSDAMFVDVIHSNGENLILGGLGSWQPMGHVDFYPNGGRMQTGCSNLFVGAVTDIIWSSANEGRSLCNHRRAYKFFTDSVSPKCHFPSFPCETYDDFLAGRCFGCNGGKKCGNMGYYADRAKGRGQLYLLTREEEPFCAHQYYVRVESSKSNQTVVSYGRILLTLVGDSGLNETFPLTRKDDAELTRGGVLSRMLVPHPALGIPVKVQLQYQAYSGWISSGLSRWTIDKVLLSDSFGKTSSICKKGFILNSGTPQTMRLYPGDCNYPKTNNDHTKHSSNESDDSQELTPEDTNIPVQPPFIPTQVVQIGDEVIENSNIDRSTIARQTASINTRDKNKSVIKKDGKQKINHKSEVNEEPPVSIIPMGTHIRLDLENKTTESIFSILDAADILNLPWQPLLANSLDNSPNEKESGRAFGSINKKFRGFPLFENMYINNFDNASEIVEPILKIPATKNARSHESNKTKKEITEPILGSTTQRSSTTDPKVLHIRTNRAHKPSESSSDDGILPEKKENNTDESNQLSSDTTTSEETEKTKWNSNNNDKNGKSNKTQNYNDTKEIASEIDNTFSLFQWESNSKQDVSEKKSNETSFTVQFLPSRLVSFLEKAENYARNTLLPLVSAYTPRFLFFGRDSTAENLETISPKYVPLQDDSKDNMPIIEHTQREKIDLIHNIGPPNTTDKTLSNYIKSEKQSTSLSIIDTTTSLSELSKFNIGESYPNDPIRIIKAPDMTTTTLRPVTLTSQRNSPEKIIIVYPSNARDDRKIQSHSFPEIMQFESLYQSTSSNSISRSSNNDLDVAASSNQEVNTINHAIHIDLPTYEPPITTPYPYKKPYSIPPKFIPVSYPTKERFNG